MTNQKISSREETAEAIAAAALFSSPSSTQATSNSSATADPRPGSKRPQVSYEIRGNILLVTIHQAEFQDELTVGPFRYTLRDLLEQTYPRLEVFDLQKVTFMSSRAVGVLLAHYQALGRHGGKMRICQVSPAVASVFKQMRLDMLVDIYDTVDEAIQDPWD
jgi:stage II sporulation protein AA (anti-sigma F factor antagonist)